jgi:hypothetical protein
VEGWRGRVKKQVVELYPITSNGPRLGGSTHGYTSWIAPAAGSANSACVTVAGWNIADASCDMHHALWPNLAVKPLQERSRSYRASGARPAGPLTRPHGKRSRASGKDVLSIGSSICGSLAGEPADARGLLSGTALGVPLKNWGIPT